MLVITAAWFCRKHGRTCSSRASARQQTLAVTAPCCYGSLLTLQRVFLWHRQPILLLIYCRLALSLHLLPALGHTMRF